MVEIINKLKNPVVQEARELARSKNRIDKNKVQLRGLEQLKWAKEAGLNIVSIIISSSENPVKYKGFSSTIYQTSDGILKKITETNYLIPAVGVAEGIVNEDIRDTFVLLLDDVQDYGNIGTIIRSGRAYGINNYITTNEDFDPYMPKTTDAARGTNLKVNFHRYNSPRKAVSYL